MTKKTQMVTFNRDIERPLLRKGWNVVRTFYGIGNHHHIMSRYLGTSIFQIIVFKGTCQPNQFSRFHSCFPHSEDVDFFKVILEKDDGTHKPRGG